ncbi:MAG TPA: OsmC family protein [Steroidobacteraceae bacterium]|nr:OsmC family protein [Steroidobacteraceae bacterium]
MPVHTAIIEWRREGAPFVDRRYSRAHEWRFDGGARVAASSSPHLVRAPLSNPASVDPEEAFIAALSSCHMLWFLDLAARAGYVIDRYTDHAEGHMGRRDHGAEWIAQVVLSPRVEFAAAEQPPDEQAVQALHQRAHEACFIANSVRTEVLVHGTWSLGR